MNKFIHATYTDIQGNHCKFLDTSLSQKLLSIVPQTGVCFVAFLKISSYGKPGKTFQLFQLHINLNELNTV